MLETVKFLKKYRKTKKKIKNNQIDQDTKQINL